MWIERENTEYGKLSQERKITGKFSKGKIPKMLLFYFKFKNWQYHWNVILLEKPLDKYENMFQLV